MVKADGLAGGKGVLVTDSRAEAVAWVDRWLPSGPVVVEDFLEGPEVSVFAVCTEHGAIPSRPRRGTTSGLLDGDQGPNTGGMGAYSPVDLPAGLVDEVMASVIEPTLAQMAEARLAVPRLPLCRSGADQGRAQCLWSSTSGWATPKPRQSFPDSSPT